MLPDGTAIGTALAMSLNQLKNLPSKASVIVLITDGANNTGKPSPYEAAEAARALGVRIHSIGLSTADTTQADRSLIWRWGRAPARLSRSDEAVLTRISSRTGGRFYRATDPDALRQIMREIDPLERRDVSILEQRDYQELYLLALIPGLLLLGLELALGLTWLRTLP
jgi:Ca-activated chloride channel family protein